jgi:hypothetical protein
MVISFSLLYYSDSDSNSNSDSDSSCSSISIIINSISIVMKLIVDNDNSIQYCINITN